MYEYTDFDPLPYLHLIFFVFSEMEMVADNVPAESLCSEPCAKKPRFQPPVMNSETMSHKQVLTTPPEEENSENSGMININFSSF